MQAKHSPRDGVADKTNEAPTPSGKKRLTIKDVAEKVSGKHKPKPAAGATMHAWPSLPLLSRQQAAEDEACCQKKC